MEGLHGLRRLDSGLLHVIPAAMPDEAGSGMFRIVVPRDPRELLDQPEEVPHRAAVHVEGRLLAHRVQAVTAVVGKPAVLEQIELVGGSAP